MPNMHICEATAANADEITDAFPANRKWWDYRFLYREQYSEKHC